MFSVLEKMLAAFLRDSMTALRTRPIEVGLGLLMAIYGSYLISGGFGSSGEQEAQIIMTVTLIWAGVFGASTLRFLGVIEQKERWWITGAVVVSGLVFAFASDFSTQVVAWRWMLLLTAYITAVTLAPLAVRRSRIDGGVRFWRFVARLLVRVFVCTVYGAFLYAGIALGLVALAVLLDLEFDGDIFAHIWVWIVSGLGIWMFVAGHESMVEVGEPISEAAVRWIARLGTFLVLPLVGFYLLIMYIYAARIVFTDFAPSNVISPLVLGAGILVFIGLFLVTPLRHRSNYNLLARIFSVIPVLFLPALFLAAWAILERVQQYGWTEFRYVRLLAVFCMGVVCVYALIQWFRSREMALYVVPAVVAIACALSSMGPGSAMEISKKSQINRVVDAAEEAKVLEQDGTIESESVGAADFEDPTAFRAPLRHLKETYGISTLEQFVPSGEDPSDWYSATMQALPRDYSDPYGYGPHRDKGHPVIQRVSLTATAPHSISRTGDMIPLQYLHDGNFIELSDRTLRATIDGGKVRWADDDTGRDEFEVTFDGLQDILGDRSEGDTTLPDEFRTITVYDTNGNDIGVLVVSVLTITEVDGEVVIDQIEKGWLILDGDW